MSTPSIVKSLRNALPHDSLMDEFRNVVGDAEELLRVTTHQAGEGAEVARARIEKSLHTAKVRLQETEAMVLDHTRQAAKATDQYVHANPWQAIGIAACAGVIFGMLVARQQ